ncbi:MAG: NADH-quinone oxidoreductase subunit M, partial [Pseudomonadota bacterium]
GVILSAAYALRLYREVVFGELTKDNLMAITDVDQRELIMLGVLMAFALYLGVYPSAALSVFSAPVDFIISNYNAANANLAVASGG